MSHFPKVKAIFEAGLAKHLHTALQVAVSHQGEQVAETLGTAREQQPATNEHHFPWLSAGKPITAVAILIAQEQHVLDIHHRVCEYIPEFTGGNKDKLTLVELLTQTAGTHVIQHGWPDDPWREILNRICSASISAERIEAYDPGASWFLLGEILQRRYDAPYDTIIHDLILAPLGMTSAQCRWDDSLPDDKLIPIFERTSGRLTPSPWNEKLRSTTPSPGSSIRGTARELCCFYESLLLTSKQPTPILLRETIDHMTHRHREGDFDQTLQHKVDYGLGVIIDSNRYGVETVPYGFGRYCSEETFGHGGSQCAIGFADPRHQLAVAILANGRPGEGQHQRRFRELCSALYEDLGIA